MEGKRFRADGHAGLSAVQRNPRRTGHHRRILGNGERTAQALVGRQDDLADLLALLRGAHVQADDPAQILEHQVGRLAFGVHGRPGNVARHIGLGGGKFGLALVIDTRGIPGLEGRRGGFFAVGEGKRGMGPRAGGGIDARVGGGILNGNLVPALPDHVESGAVRAQFRFGRGTFGGGGKDADGLFLDIQFALAGCQGDGGKGRPNNPFFHGAVLRVN